MSSDIVTTVSAYGDSIEIRTPKTTMDAQHAHTAKFIDAHNELRRREADRLRGAGESEGFIAVTLPAEAVLGGRDNPTRLRYNLHQAGHTDSWRPVLPLAAWSAPKPLSDREALKRARQLHGKDCVVRGVSVGQITFEELA